MKPMPHYTVYKLPWNESEQNHQKPDGYSLHLLPEHADHYVKNYRNSIPKPPNEYSQPQSQNLKQVQVSEQDFNDLQNNKKQGGFGLRYYK